MAGLALLTLGAAPASFTRDELQQLERERQAAEAELAALEAAGDVRRADLDTLEQRLIAAAMESRRREAQAANAELRLIELSAQLTAARDALLANGVALEDLLGLLVSSGQRRPPALIVSPGQANTAIRRAILTSDAAPQLAARVDTLSAEIAEMNVLERDIRGERARLAAAEAVLELKQAEILKLVASKRAAYQSVAGEAEALRRQVAELGREAGTLRSLLAALEENAPPMPTHKPRPRVQLAALSPSASPTASDAAPLGLPPAALKPLGQEALGALARPAAGLIRRSFGQPLPGVGQSQGLFIETRPGAQIAAPVDGRIEYAGSFRSYGQMLILRTSDGYHVILSGLSRLYAEPGDTVSTGEPIGAMPERTAPAPELYMELRKDGAPMNPARWMK